MNTANLQLEGFLLAVASVTRALVKKGVIETAEIDAALAEAEAATDRSPSSSLSAANRDAVRFPIRFLRRANEAAEEGQTFAELARAVGAANHPDWW